MTPDEVLNSLKILGITLSRSSLTRYENQGLIPEPVRGGGGPGGRYTHYPDQTVSEAYASWCLLHGEYLEGEERSLFADGRVPKLSPVFVMKCRLIALGVLKDQRERKQDDTPLPNLVVVKDKAIWVDDYRPTLEIVKMVHEIELMAKFPLTVAMGQFGARAWLNALAKAEQLTKIKP